MEMGISAAQMRAIHALARKAQMDDAVLHEMIYNTTGKTSIRLLSAREAGGAIERMKAMCGQEITTPADRATERQTGYIYALAGKLGWADEPKRLRAFLEKRFGITDVRFLRAKQASGVIESLKAMLEGGRGERNAL